MLRATASRNPACVIPRPSLLHFDRGQRRQQPVLVGVAALEPARARAGIALAGMEDAGVVDDEAFTRRQLERHFHRRDRR